MWQCSQQTFAALHGMQQRIVQLTRMLDSIHIELNKLGNLDWLEQESLLFAQEAYSHMMALLKPDSAPGVPSQPGTCFSRWMAEKLAQAETLHHQYVALQEHNRQVEGGLNEMLELFGLQAIPAISVVQQTLGETDGGMTPQLAGIRKDIDEMGAAIQQAGQQVAGLHDQVFSLQKHISVGMARSQKHLHVITEIAQSMCEIEYNSTIISGCNPEAG